MGTKKIIGRFVSPSLAVAYPGHRRAGQPMTGLHFDSVELVCELNELRELLTSAWFVALGNRRRDADQPLKLTVITEVPA